MREELLSIFSSLVPTKQLAIECVDPSCVSAGLTFKVAGRRYLVITPSCVRAGLTIEVVTSKQSAGALLLAY